MFSNILNIENFIPLSAKSNADDLRRSKIVLVMTLALAPMGFIYCTIYYNLGNYITATVLAAFTAYLFLTPLLFRRIGSYKVYGFGVSLGVFLCVISAYSTSGSAIFTGIPWFIFSPIAAYIIGENRWGIIWICLALVFTTSLFLLEYRFGVPIPNYTLNPIQDLLLFRDWFHYIGSLLAVVISISFFENSRKAAAKAEKESYEKLITAKDQLLQAEKLSAIGQMVAGVAHEVNSPRASVDHFLTLTEKQIDKILALSALPDTAKIPASAIKDTYLPSMNLAITRIGELTNGLLNFTRADHKEMKPSDLHQIMDSVLILLKGQFHNRIQVKKEYGSIPQVMCYPGQINQVFMNILTNAAQSMPDASGDITIKTWRENHHVSVSIKDTGSGMSEETKKKIFDPFFTTKEVGKGTGLGMSIVWDILQKHKATIDVQSQIGQGTTFIIGVPVTQ